MEQQVGRRKDLELREAVDVVQSSATRSLFDIYEKTLSQIMRLSKARYGVFFSFSQSENALPFIPVLGYECVASGGGGEGPVEWRPLKQSDAARTSSELSRWKSALTSGEPVFLTQPFDLDLCTVFGNEPTDVGHLVILPLRIKDRLDNVVLLGSKAIITPQTLTRLCPLLRASTNVKASLLGNPGYNPGAMPSTVKEGQNTSFESLFLHLQEFSFNSIITTNKYGNIVSINRVAKVLLGVTDTERIIGKPLSNFMVESFPNELQATTEAYGPLTMVRNRYFPSRWTCRTVGGRALQVNMTYFQYVTNAETYNLYILEDKTELINEQYTREVEERRFRAVADIIPIGILQANERWEMQYVNSSWCEMSGLAAEELVGHKWVNSIHEAECQQIIEDLSRALKGGKSFEVTCRFQTPLGKTTWIDLNVQPLLSHENHLDGFIISANDVTLHRTNEEKLRKVAHFDSLTQLANRSLLNDRLRHLITRLPRSHSKLAVLYIDLDGFKNVNDSLGHDCGDIILKEVAARLLGCVRKNDTVARLGGDEFVVLLEDVNDHYDVSMIAGKIIDKVAKPYFIASQEIFLTTSVGITLSNDNLDPSHLLKQADIALYQAKSEGKNNFQFYSNELGEESVQRLNLINSLHKALEREEFRVYYQPQADLRSGRIVGFEALLRWQPRSEETIGADKFVPLLEESGLIQKVGRWLVAKAVEDFRHWQDLGLIDDSVHMSINLSPRQFRDKKLISMIKEVVEQYALDPGRLVFEITETLLLGDTIRCRALIQELKQIGARIALDDFGTGFSSLSHIKNFPIDIIKIDKAFVQDMLRDKEDAAIVRAVLAMAESLGKETVAEGVDDVPKLQYLKKLNCQVYQGFLLSKPISAASTELFLKRVEQPVA